jgi:hypothetical protein
MKKIILAVFVVATIPLKSFAGDEVINQLLFFYGQQNIKPTQANDMLKSAGFTEELSKLTFYGVQASRDITPKFNLGLRGLIATTRVEIPDTYTTTTENHRAYIMRTNLSVILSSPVIKTEKFKAEGLLGFGAGGASLDLKNGTQDGDYGNSSSGPTALIGAALYFGYKYVFLRVEGGYEYNDVGSLTKKGTLTSNLEKLDLSGGYFSVGLTIDGLALGKL